MFKIVRAGLCSRLLPALLKNRPSSSVPFKVEPEKPVKFIADNDPDVFGSLSVSLPESARDDDDLEEEKYEMNPPSQSQKLGMRQYADMMKEHLKNGRIFEAIDVIETRMLEEDRVKPTNYIYNIAIDGCARVGYTKKAFSLFNRMKERGLQITGATYTSLFNACAMSPFKADALAKARDLREAIVEKNYVPNVTNYNAMIKAFGRLGDLTTAFKIVDEMQTAKVPVRLETINFLLQACASDHEVGFRHALLVWQKIHRRRMVPDLYSFNLLLRCTRDCGLGDVQETEEVLRRIVEDSEKRKLAIEASK